MNVNKDVFQQYESEARGYCRRFEPIFTSANGSIIRDTEDNEYIDFLAACGSLNYGHNDPDMREALVQHLQSDGLSASLDLFSVAKGRFLTAFNELILSPRQLNYRMQFTGPTGTNAVEAAMKLARKFTGRQNIIAFTNGFHGVTLGSLAATGNKYNRMNGAGTGLNNITRIPFEGYAGSHFDSADYLEQLLNDPSSGIELPAAILFETVQGEGGLNTASPKWAQRISEIAKRHGALVIVDDIQAGCGRTGTFFSFETLDIEPDIVTMAKSISGYGLPMAVVLMKPEYDVWGAAEHNGTFRGNTHAFITATVALEKFWSDNDFSQNTLRKAALVTRHLHRISQHIPNSYIKGRGMMQGLCIDDGSGELADKISRQAFTQGLMIETSGPHDEVIKILAPLTTPTEHLEAGLTILEQAAKNIITHHTVPVPIYTTVHTKKIQPVVPFAATLLANKNANRPPL